MLISMMMLITMKWLKVGSLLKILLSYLYKELDYCGRCWAAQQKYYSSPFKIKHKGPGQTLYQRDYVKHPLDSQGPVLKNDFYTTWANNEPMDYGTTMRVRNL